MSINPKDIFETTSLELNREVELVNNRINWMLTFQGFLFAAISFVINGSEDIYLQNALYFSIPFSGIVISVFTLFGIYASQKQRDRIKAFWEKQSFKNDFPPFYSTPSNSKTGRLTAIGMPYIMLFAWVIFLVALLCKIILK